MIGAIRAVAFALAFYATTLAVGLAALPLLLGPPRWLRTPLRIWAGTTLWFLRWICGIGVEVTGREHLPTSGAALIAARHESAFDTVVWMRLLPDPTFVVKRELFAIPVYGWHVRRFGSIGVDRAAGASALRHLVRGAQAALAAGRQVVIFPEGTRVPTGQRSRMQPGIAAMASMAGLPVVPVATNSGRYWQRGWFAKRPGTITVAVLPPLPAGLPKGELLSRLQSAIDTGQAQLQPGRAVDNVVDSRPELAEHLAFDTRRDR